MIMKSLTGVLSAISFPVVLAFVTNIAFAQEQHADHPEATPRHADHAVHQDLKSAATDPSAILTQLGFFYTTQYTKGSDEHVDTFLFQPVLPLSKGNVLRPALPVISTSGPRGEEAIGDLFLLDVFLNQTSWGTWGFGPVASIPTATKDELGSEKWEVGPAVLAIYKKVPKNIFGILAYNLTDVAGDDDREDVNKFIFQPIWVRHFDWGYIGWTDLTAVIDWENDNDYSIPLGLRFGKVWMGKTPLNVNIQPFYTVNEDRDNDYGIKLSFTLVKPGWLTH